MIEEALKFIDVYKADKKFDVPEVESNEKRNEDNEIDYKFKVGSKVGGTFSMVLYSIVMW